MFPIPCHPAGATNIDGRNYIPLVYVGGSEDAVRKLLSSSSIKHRFGKNSGDGDIFVCHPTITMDHAAPGYFQDITNDLFIGMIEWTNSEGGTGYLYCNGYTIIRCTPDGASVGYNSHSFTIADVGIASSCEAQWRYDGDYYSRYSLRPYVNVTLFGYHRCEQWPRAHTPPKPEDLLPIIESCRALHSDAALRAYLNPREYTTTASGATGGYSIAWDAWYHTPRIWYANPNSFSTTYIPSACSRMYLEYLLGSSIQPSFEGLEEHSPLGEYAWVSDSFEGLISLPYLDDAMSEAALALYRSVPEAQFNAFANVMDIFSTLKKLRKGDLSGVGTVSEAWLSYRYAYSTTKSDIEELSSVLTRLLDLCGQEVPMHGNYSKHYIAYRPDSKQLDFEVKAHCTAKSKLTQLDEDRIRNFLDKAGLKLNLLNAWDLVPYSFIVDWVLPISDLLGNMDTMYEEQHLNYKVYGWCTSVEVTFDGERGPVCNYARKIGYKPPLKITSAISGSDPHSRGVFYHIADLLAIFGGK